MARSQSLPAALWRHAQMILRMVDGESNTAIAHRYGVSRPTATFWRTRQRERGIAGLHNELKPGRPRTTSDAKVAELVQINQFVEHYNQHPRPFKWTATADSILAKIERLCKVINGTEH